MNKTTKNDLVEILDNGIHAGWGEVVAGKWSVALANVPLGSQNLTAKYRGVTSDRWEIVLKASPRVDNFDDLRLGAVESLVRPFFTITYQTQGYNKGVEVMTVRTAANEVRESPCILFMAYGFGGNKYNVNAYISFNDDYSSVSFWVRPQYDEGTKRVLVVASDNNGLEIDSFNLALIPSRGARVIKLQGRGTQKIRKITIFLESGSGGAHAFIDDFVMEF